MNVPAPDDSVSFPDKNFEFNRLGVRIPTLLISPWVAKGTVIGAPHPSEKPFNNSEFDLTSVISTVRKLLNHPTPLTKRDAWSATFDERLSEPSPRTDCPMTLPDAPKSLGAASAAAEGSQQINHLQVDILRAFRTLAGHNETTHPLPKLQGEGGEWISKLVDQVLAGDHVLAKRTESP
jgi:phospholipase C